MSELRIQADSNPGTDLFHSDDHEAIAGALSRIGVRFEQWPVDRGVRAGTAPDDVLAAYAGEIDKLKASEGFVIVDAISLTADHPGKEELRGKFLAEHTHAEDEVRFFAAGEGLFSLHVDDRVYEILCTSGDLISVPADTRHWFDMGPNPGFAVLRFFQNPDGWVGHFTGSDIADRFSRLEN